MSALSWILIVAIAQLIYAVTAIVDKFIITSKKVSKPFIYAFYVTFLSAVPIGLFLLSPFRFKIGDYALPLFENVSSPAIGLILMSIISAVAGFFALYSMYSALREADASDVIPVIGSISAIGTFILSYLIFSDVLPRNFFIGFILLVIGTAFISHFRFNKKVIALTFASGLLYAVKVTLVKHLFILFSFDQVFFWSRIAILLVVIIFLFYPTFRKKFKIGNKATSNRGRMWVLGNAILGGIAAFMLLKATDIGNVTIVQALGGLQFLFLTIFSILFGRVTNRDIGENNTVKDVLQKTVSAILIVAGFLFLFLMR